MIMKTLSCVLILMMFLAVSMPSDAHAWGAAAARLLKAAWDATPTPVKYGIVTVGGGFVSSIGSDIYNAVKDAVSGDEDEDSSSGTYTSSSGYSTSGSSGYCSSCDSYVVGSHACYSSSYAP